MTCNCVHGAEFPHSPESRHCYACEHSEETVGPLVEVLDRLLCEECKADL
jgi:hypothetical protein